jgi:glutaredoxin-like YruB-family protein
MKVEIYSTPACGYCKMAKQFMQERNVEFTEYDVAVDVAKRQEMIEKSGQMGVPVIDVDGQLMIGFDRASLAKLLGVEA